MSNDLPERSVTLLTISQVPIRIHYSYIVFVIAIILGLVTAYGGAWALKTSQILGYLFICVLVHELGHASAAHALGHKVRDVTIYPVGGLATIEIKDANPHDIGWIAFAGPAANFILFFVCLFFEEMSLSSLGVLSLILGASNLLPIKSFDGGVILKCLLTKRIGKVKTETALMVSSIFIVAIVGVIGLYLKSFLICLSAAFMFVYGVLLND